MQLRNEISATCYLDARMLLSNTSNDFLIKAKQVTNHRCSSCRKIKRQLKLKYNEHMDASIIRILLNLYFNFKENRKS